MPTMCKNALKRILHQPLERIKLKSYHKDLKVKILPQDYLKHANQFINIS